MSIAQTYSAHLVGLFAEIVTVEVDIANGLHAFSVVGLGDRAVEEAKDRIGAAIKNTGYISPKQKNQKVVISLAPADVRKEGAVFDLSMALAYLSAADDIEFEYEHRLFLGELSLEGAVRRVNGVLPMLILAAEKGFTEAFVPRENAEEASLARNIIVYAVSSLREVIDHLSRTKKIAPQKQKNILPEEDMAQLEHDMSYIRGNETAKRGLEIAAAGGHTVALYGPPGTGKTMLAQSFTSILPMLTYEQSVEVTGIHSAIRALSTGLILQPPFRAPHHTASAISILGGGSNLHPGEITLAHRGVLFMDEFPEFDRRVIEALRQPLEDRVITISRAKGSVTYPAQCILIAAMNPCRCGKGDSTCICPPHIREAYRRRISAPVLDRLDLWVSVNTIDYGKLAAEKAAGEDSVTIRKRVRAARALQAERFKGKKHLNSEMDASDIEKLALIDDKARETLKISAERFGFSGRAFHRTIKIARTIADLSGSKYVAKDHMLEAVQYRQKKI